MLSLLVALLQFQRFSSFYEISPMEKNSVKALNPDVAIAYGAAVQAAILSGNGNEKIQKASVVIPRNTTIPATKQKAFTTAYDCQTSVRFSVIEGERVRSTDNKLLGQFVLSGIPPAPRGVARLMATFDIDANGVLNVTAEDNATGVRNNVRITNSMGRLSKEEIERMVSDAERFKAEDEEHAKKIQAMNTFENYLKNCRNFIWSVQFGSIPAVRNSLEDVIENEFHWLDGNRLAGVYEFEYKMQKLEHTCNQILARMGGGLY